MYVVDTKPGNIPGSTNIPSRSIQGPYICPDGAVVKHGKLKTVEECQEIFRSHNVDLAQPMAITCGSGK